MQTTSGLAIGLEDLSIGLSQNIQKESFMEIISYQTTFTYLLLVKIPIHILGYKFHKRKDIIFVNVLIRQNKYTSLYNICIPPKITSPQYQQ